MPIGSRIRAVASLPRRIWRYARLPEAYLDAFLAAGLRLTKLADLSAVTSGGEPGGLLPGGHRFRRFMLLAFTKP